MENLDSKAFKNAHAKTGPTDIQSLALNTNQQFWGTKQRIMEYAIKIAYSRTTHYKVY